jgi:hypothetical protein
MWISPMEEVVPAEGGSSFGPYETNLPETAVLVSAPRNLECPSQFLQEEELTGYA